MTRYVAIPRAWHSPSHPPESRPTCEVYEADRAPVATGLLDAGGVPIYRVRHGVPMGVVLRAREGSPTAERPARARPMVSEVYQGDGG